MQTSYTSNWLPITKANSQHGNVYIYIGNEETIKIEGWLTFPKGAKAARFAIFFDDETEKPDNNDLDFTGL